MLTWVLGFWLLLPFNLVILLSIAFFPPFATWYTARYRFHQMQTHERVQMGLAFIPFFKYALSAVGEIAVAITFTQFQMMPFRRPDGTPVYGMESVWNNRCAGIGVGLG